MQFCEKCDNLTSLKTNDEQTQLLSECMQCGFSVVVQNDENQRVFRKQYARTTVDPHTFINQYTALDPTLPRLRNKVCVNKECLSHSGNLWKVEGLRKDEVAKLMAVSQESLKVHKQWSDTEWLLHLPNVEKFPIEHTNITPFECEVVYIKYDDLNMKYLYICTTCNQAWKNE